MPTWPLTPSPAGPAQTALAGLIGDIGRPSFPAAALAHLRPVLGAASWAVYRLRPGQVPTLHLSASHARADATRHCFAVYRDAGLYQHDSSFEPVRAQPRPGPAVMLRMHADDAPSTLHREAIYVAHGLVERLSVGRLEPDGSLLAVNLYRHAEQGAFGPDAVAHFGLLAPALLAAAARHAEWAAPCPREALRQRCAALTARELDVLERLLQGLTYDGIAADLGLSVATVKTYRLRAFERLGLHFKSELFASFLPPGGG